MGTNKILNSSSFLPHQKPKKIIFMLHGYGDSADNFVHIANHLNQIELEVNYIALNAPFPVINYSLGRQWFDLYPNGIYISEAGSKEINIIRSEILASVKFIEKNITQILDTYQITYKDCFLMGFSQGGMMTFEFGNYFQEMLGGLAILSGRIMSDDSIKNKFLSKTPIFISHGNLDEVLPIKVFYSACNYLSKNKFQFESHIMDGDSHTVSPEAIILLQKFIEKNL